MIARMTLIDEDMEADIAVAARCIASGGLVAFPTETVYGLGGDATNDQAVARIFAAKNRPEFNPLIVHVADTAAAERLARLTPPALALARRFWPGPLTLVLPRRAAAPISLLASAGLDTLAIRVPAHATARRLIDAAGRPIAAPSANRSGRLSPTTAAHVRDELGALVDIVLDGGPCGVGLESTIVDLSGASPTLLRPGGLAVEAIETVIGPLARLSGGEVVLAPGMLASHYAPERPLRLDAMAPMAGEAFLAFGATDYPAAQLSATGDVDEAAANLFAMLRLLDRPPFAAIAVMKVPEQGLGIAINDRLRRAAAPRA